MVKNKNNSHRKGLWIIGLIIQGLAILLFSRYLITLDAPTNIVGLVILIGAYLAIVIPTIKLLQNKNGSNDYTVALGILNIVAIVVSIGFLVFMAGLYDALHN